MPYCSGPFMMRCPLGTYATIEDIKVLETNKEEKIVPYQTTTGFCVEKKGIETTIVQTEQTGCLDLPTIKTEDPIAEQKYVYAWFTTNGLKKTTLESIWAELVVKATGEVLLHNDNEWHLSWGPLAEKMEYEVCIKASAAKDMILHVRLGGPNEDL